MSYKIDSQFKHKMTIYKKFADLIDKNTYLNLVYAVDGHLGQFKINSKVNWPRKKESYLYQRYLI